MVVEVVVVEEEEEVEAEVVEEEEVEEVAEVVVDEEEEGGGIGGGGGGGGDTTRLHAVGVAQLLHHADLLEHAVQRRAPTHLRAYGTGSADRLPEKHCSGRARRQRGAAGRRRAPSCA